MSGQKKKSVSQKSHTEPATNRSIVRFRCDFTCATVNFNGNTNKGEKEEEKEKLNCVIEHINKFASLVSVSVCRSHGFIPLAHSKICITHRIHRRGLR